MKKLFLDLEGTLIESWHSPIFLVKNIETIKNFIKENKTQEAILFSMAITNLKECAEFDSFLKKDLERLLGINLVVIPFEKFVSEIAKKHNLSIKGFRDSLELFPFNIKEQVFIEFAKIIGNNNEEFFLFDDLVTTQEINIHNLKIQLINM